MANDNFEVLQEVIYARRREGKYSKNNGLKLVYTHKDGTQHFNREDALAYSENPDKKE